MNSIVNLKDGFITFNSNIDHSLSFSKCAIGYSNYSINSHERGALVFLTNNNANTANVSMHSDIRMCIASDGNIGIGTNNPSQKLDIAGNTNISRILKIGGINQNDDEIKLQVYASSNNIIAIFKHPNDSQGIGITYDSIFALGSDTNVAQPIAIKSKGNTNVVLNTNSIDRLTVLGNGNVGIGTNNANSRLHLHNTTANSDVGIRFSDFTSGAGATQGFAIGENSTQQAYLLNYGNTDMLFSTNNAERLRILANGNVGIGTTIPETALDVNGNLLIRAYGTTGSGTKGIFFRPDFVTTNQYNCSILTFDHSSSGANDGISINGYQGVSFCTGANTRQERMRISENGNVGIGTTNPAYRTHIKCVYDDISKGLHLDASDAVPSAPNQYALTIYAYIVGGGQIGWKFRTQSLSGGTQTPLTFDHAGNVILGGTISGNGSLLTTINAANISSGTISSLRLPVATTSVLGGVKVDGTTITINSSTGVISGANTYVLPTATTSVLGGVKVDGTTITINSSTGVISGANTYVLPTATTSVLGGVKVDGTTITINSSTGVISGANTYVLPTATTSVLGGVKKGNNINIFDGTISVDLLSYNGDSTINGNLVVNSNLIIHGTSTTLNTEVYTTERLDITNAGANSTLTIKQTASGNTSNILNVINSSSTNVFNISSMGNVGIGTTNPTSKLHIATPDVATPFALLDFRNNGNFGIYATSQSVASRGNTLDFLARDYNLNGTIATRNVLSLTPEGNVGIGKNNPSYTLDVGGNINCSAILVNGSSIPIYDDTALTALVNTKDANVSNYVRTTSNILLADFVARDGVLTADYIARDVVLDTKINTNDLNVSNYVSTTSNYLKSVIDAIGTSGYGDANVSTYLETTATKTIGGILHVGESSGGGTIKLGGTTDDTGFDLATIQNRQYATVKSEIVIFKGNDIEGSSGADRIRLRAGAIAFDTYSAASTSATTESIRMYITGAGNVGIGTTTPDELLTIRTTTTTARLRLVSSSGTGSTWIRFMKSDGNTYGYDVGYDGTTTNNLQFIAYNNSATGRIDMQIARGNGNVGIGTAPSATYKLDVNGSINASSLLINGTTINQSRWTPIPDTLGTSVYYNGGGVIVGTIANSSDNGNINITMPDSTLYVRGTAIGNGQTNITFRGGLEGFSNGKVKLWLLNDAGHSSYIQSEHTGNGNTHLTFGTANGNALPVERMRISENGNVGIGTNDPAIYKCQVNGNLGATGNITAYYSDERLKNITEYVSDVLPALDKINVFKYNCNDLAESFGYDKSKKEIGLSAQEIQKFYPEIVSIAPFDADCDKETKQIISKSGENYLTLDYERLVPVLLQAIKELNRKYTALEDKYNKIMPT